MPGQRDPTSRWVIGDILERTDLAVLLDELTQSSGRLGPGRRWHCPIPDHDDHRASVSMFRDRHGHERWRCWSADHRGDAVDLVIATSNRTRAEAIDWLATRAGMSPDRPLPAIQPKRTPIPGPSATVMSPLVDRYVRVCESVMRGPQGREVRDWLHARGINDDTIRANRIGADPGRDFFHRHKGLPRGTGIAATLPALDPTGHITYVQARYLNPDQTGRKYDNPAAALAPHPRLAFPATSGQQRDGVLIVCEGIPDALIAAQAGYASVALLGAQTPDEAVAIRIANHATNTDRDIVMVCDPDPAGRHVADTLTAHLANQGIIPTVITPPDGCDLNGWALDNPDWATTLDTSLRHTGHTTDLDIDAGIEL